ncbi:MAG TPA: hypothetical protein PLW66_13910, partial [Saprospiraceae bacterium]|nr:hypothetical protein [Saprospiraceae bacterium]
MKKNKSKPTADSTKTGSDKKASTRPAAKSAQPTPDKKKTTAPAAPKAKTTVKTTRPKGVSLASANNRLLIALENVSFRNKAALKTIVRHAP